MMTRVNRITFIFRLPDENISVLYCRTRGTSQETTYKTAHHLITLSERSRPSSKQNLSFMLSFSCCNIWTVIKVIFPMNHLTVQGSFPSCHLDCRKFGRDKNFRHGNLLDMTKCLTYKKHIHIQFVYQNRPDQSSKIIQGLELF